MGVDPFASLIDAVAVEPEENLLISMDPAPKREGKPKRTKAQLSALEKAPAALYGPDSRLIDELGYEPPASAYTVGQFPPKRRVRPSDLPLAVLTSAHLADARKTCDYLALQRSLVPDAVTSNPTNRWLEAADLLLRLDGYTFEEVSTVIDYLFARGSLKTWVTQTYVLRTALPEILTSNAFGLWTVSEGRTFPAEKIESARRRADSGGGAKPARNGLIGTPSGVRDEDHATGGRREITF